MYAIRIRLFASRHRPLLVSHAKCVITQPMKTRAFLRCFVKAGDDTFINHDGIEHAGYLAFLMLLSLFPFLVFFAAIAGSAGQLKVSQQLIDTVIRLLPADILAALTPRIQEIASGPPQGLLTLAILGVIWTASSAVEGARTSLNRAYRVETPPAYVWRRLLSIVQFLILTLAAFIAMFWQIIAPVLWEKIERLTGAREELLGPFWTYIRYTVSGLLLFLTVAISYYVLPNAKQTWRSVVPGALIVIALWMLAADVLSSYLHHFNQLNVVYGSLGGFIIALVFFYLVALIYIFGAEFNYHLERALGHKPQEKEKVSRMPKRRRRKGEAPEA